MAPRRRVQFFQSRKAGQRQRPAWSWAAGACFSSSFALPRATRRALKRGSPGASTTRSAGMAHGHRRGKNGRLGNGGLRGGAVVSGGGGGGASGQGVWGGALAPAVIFFLDNPRSAHRATQLRPPMDTTQCSYCVQHATTYRLYSL
jgi:hypothetical protein